MLKNELRLPLFALALIGLSVFASPGSALADADFFKGKTIRVIVGYGPGGGYDLYGRVASEWLGRYIPGNPVLITQNMPGGGSLVAAKYLYDGAPKDGTTLGIIAQTFPLDAATQGEKLKLDATKLPYIGRLTTEVSIGHGMPGAPFKTGDDARRMEIMVGATGGASSAVLVPKALNAYAGTKFKIVTGYKGSAEVFLAAERGEVQFVSSNGLSVLLANRPEIVTAGRHPIVYQTSLRRHPALPNVATIGELGLTEEGKLVLRAIAASADIGKSINTTPGIAKDKLQILRTSFQKMVTDPGFTEKMKERKVMIEPATAEEVEAIVTGVTSTPKHILEAIAKLL